jgi:hypothetical protein
VDVSVASYVFLSIHPDVPQPVGSEEPDGGMVINDSSNPTCYPLNSSC